ncbi:MAG: hypothetical protein OEV30_12645 [Ignavibacteria bacterium]|nr:hypothetical protein [Ignavibacteria bacterium]
MLQELRRRRGSCCLHPFLMFSHHTVVPAPPGWQDYIPKCHRSALLLFLVLAFTITGYSQKTESHVQPDSLSSKVDSTILDYTNEIEDLLERTEGDTTQVPEDRLSRRKRLDALLKEYRDQPGVLFFSGDMTGILQYSPDEGDPIGTGTGSFDIYGHTRLGEDVLVFINLEAIGGNGPNDELFTFSSLNADAGSTADSTGLDRLHIPEAWVEFSPFGNAFTITAGKIDLTNYVDNNRAANDEMSQFITGAFVNSAALAVPVGTPGLRIRTTIANLAFLQLAVVKDLNEGARIFEDAVTVGSTGFKVFPLSDWEANVRVFGYFDGRLETNSGWGLSVDQTIAGQFMLFGRWNKNSWERARTYGIRNAWSVGSQFLTTLFGLEFVTGVALGLTTSSDLTLETERVIELYLRQQMNEWIFLSPHLQLVQAAGGTDVNRTFLGLRAQLNF